MEEPRTSEESHHGEVQPNCPDETAHKKTVTKKAGARAQNFNLKKPSTLKESNHEEVSPNLVSAKGGPTSLHDEQKEQEHAKLETKQKESHTSTFTRKKLKCIFTNARSIMNKVDELHCIIEEEKPDLVSIVETWLTDNIFNAEIQIPGYQTTRLDRKTGAHGGILLYTRDGINVQPRESQTLAEYDEALWCDISSDDTALDLLLGIVYRSPNNSQDQNDCLNRVLSHLNDEHKDVMIVGDFNYRDIDWETMQATSSKSDAFLEVVQDNLWYQHVMQPTRLESLLDLVITSNPDMIDEVDVLAHLGSSDHNMLKWELNYYVQPSTAQSKRDYKNADFDQIRSKLKKINWKKDLENLSTDQAWDTTKEKLQQLIHDHVPLKRQSKKKKAIWLTRRAQKCIRRKQRAWKRYKSNKTTKNLEHYKLCQREAKREIKTAKRDFEKKLAQNIKEDSKSFYAYVRSKQKVKDTVGPLKQETGETIPSGQQTADVLNEYFASVYTDEDQNVPNPKNFFEGPEKELLVDIDITEECVKRKLEDLDPSKAAGPDGIPPAFLKPLAEELSVPYTCIFNKSVKEGIVPEDWRLAHITPIFKKGSRSKPGNYRPISLTSVTCKVLETIIRDKITEHLDKHGLIHDTQHGFRKGKSTTTNLLEYLEIITKSVDEGTPIDVVYLDLAKAFDTVPHKRLLKKIKAHGIDGNILRWIAAWLNDRKQKVVTQGAESSWKPVTSSVVQGSVLGPLCFLIYMNDLEIGLDDKSTVSKFADDTKLIYPVRTDSDRTDMQNSINHLHSWANTWQMRYNADKCGVMHLGAQNPHHTYTMGSTQLTESTVEKDLGVLVHKSLKVASQCAAAAKKGNRALGMIKRNFAFRSKEVILKLYKSLVRPHLDYAIQAWCPYLEKDKKILEKVQARATKLISSIQHLSYEQRLAKLRLTTLEKRRERGDLLQTYRIMTQIDKTKPVHYFQFANYDRTRGHSMKLAKTRSRLDIRKNFYSQRVVDKWNKLPQSAIDAPTLLSFKQELTNLGF